MVQQEQLDVLHVHASAAAKQQTSAATRRPGRRTIRPSRDPLRQPLRRPRSKADQRFGTLHRGGRGAAHTATGRAPRGQNRRVILEAISDAPKTAGDVAKETGIGPPTVSTTLTKLVSDGAAVKAKRGYKAA